VHDVLGRVLVHVDLLEDHLALRVQIRRSDHAVLQHVGEMLHGHRQVAIQHAGVEARVLLRRERVEVTAHGVEALGDIESAARRRALEEQVLEEVAGPADRGILVARAGEHPDAERDRADAGHPLGHDAQPG
jgi:hypothetical protein